MLPIELMAEVVKTCGFGIKNALSNQLRRGLVSAGRITYDTMQYVDAIVKASTCICLVQECWEIGFCSGNPQMYFTELKGLCH